MRYLPLTVSAALLAAIAMLQGCKQPSATPAVDGEAAVDSGETLAPAGVFFLRVVAQGKLNNKIVEQRPGTMLNKVGENRYRTPDGAELFLGPEHVSNDMRIVRLIRDEERRRKGTPIAATPAWQNPLTRSGSERGSKVSPRNYTPAPVQFR